MLTEGIEGFCLCPACEEISPDSLDPDFFFVSISQLFYNTFNSKCANSSLVSTFPSMRGDGSTKMEPDIHHFDLRNAVIATSGELFIPGL